MLERHFTPSDLAHIEELASQKVQEPEGRADFEIYVLLRAIPKLVGDIRTLTPQPALQPVRL